MDHPALPGSTALDWATSSSLAYLSLGPKVWKFRGSRSPRSRSLVLASPKIPKATAMVKLAPVWEKFLYRLARP